MTGGHPVQSTEPLACDILVVGAGPGGYSAAFRAADLGANVVLVDTRPVLGGVCLNEGCIPSKALLHIAGELRSWRRLQAEGIVQSAPEPDVDAIRTRVGKTITGLNKGLASLARNRKVQTLTGHAEFTSPTTATITLADGSTTALTFAKAILATGSRASHPADIDMQHPKAWSAADALKLPLVPERLLILGGGIIGLEMATVYSSLGAAVTVLEIAPVILPCLDDRLRRIWRTQNKDIVIHTGQVIQRIQMTDDNVVIQTAQETHEAHVLLVATGRTPVLPDGLAHTGIAQSADDTIATNRHMQSSVPHLYAIGDLTGGPMLAHRASRQGHIAAEHATGDSHAAWDQRVIPSVAYTDPEIAWAGTTAAEEGIRAVDFPWAANGKALATGATGLTRLFYREDTRQVTGALIMGDHAGDLLQEALLAIEMGAELEDLAGTIHPHPTLVETLGNAAEAALGTITEL